MWQRRKRERGFSGWWLAEKRGAFFRQGVLRKMYGYEVVEEKKSKKIYCKIEMPIIFIKGSCVETPLYTMCWVNKDGDKGQVWEQGEELGGWGRGRYEVRRVKGAFSVITCNLTASATNLLVSAVPRIWIAVSKSPFLIGLKSYVYCHTISPGSYISWHKGAAHPLPPTVFSLHPPPHISSLRVILCIISLWPQFLFSPIPFSFQFSQRGCGFLVAM